MYTYISCHIHTHKNIRSPIDNQVVAPIILGFQTGYFKLGMGPQMLGASA